MLDLAQRVGQTLELGANEQAHAHEQDSSSRHTRTGLQVALSRGNSSKDAILPCSLEPDAPFREGRRLHSMDEADHLSLLRSVWLLLRAGKLERARQLCRRCGQPWRAASIGGGVPFHYDRKRRCWVGNPSRAVWRKACEVIATRAQARPAKPTSKYEAAVYGMLSGVAPKEALVLPACSGWEETLWVHLSLALGSHTVATQACIAAQAAVVPSPLPHAAVDELFFRAEAAHGQDTVAARHYHVMQRSFFRVRVAQLPPRSGDTPGDASVALSGLVDLMRTQIASSGNTHAEQMLATHLLRFASHASFVFYLPIIRTVGHQALRTHGGWSWNLLLREYVGQLGEAAAHVAALPSGLAATGSAATTFPTSGTLQADEPQRPQLGQMAAAVALLASNLRHDGGMDDNAIVEGIASFLLRLPADLSTCLMHEAMAQTHALLQETHLPARIALCVVLRRHALPLPLLRAEPCASDGISEINELCLEASSRLQVIRWMTFCICATERMELEVSTPRLVQLHHALAHCGTLLRSAFLRAGCTTDALVPPSAGAGEPSGGVFVRDGTFEIVQQRADGLVLLVFLPAVHGVIAEPAVYAATAHHAGVPAPLLAELMHGRRLPCRARLTLCADQGALFFRVEDTTVLAPDLECASAAMLAARYAQANGQVQYSMPLPANLQLLEEVEARCAQARQAAALFASCVDATSDVSDTTASWPPALPALLDEPIAHLQAEVQFWGLALNCTAEFRAWLSLLCGSDRCIGPAQHPSLGAYFASAAMREEGATGGRGEWRLELQRCARRLATRLQTALTATTGSLGPLPMDAEIAKTWRQGRAAEERADAMAFDPGERAGILAVCSVRGLHGLRGEVVPSLVHQLHQVLVETGRATVDRAWLHESLGLVNLLADERNKLYECFSGEGLRKTLALFRSSALEVLGSG